MTDDGFHDRIGLEIDAIQSRLRELKQERARLGALAEERRAAADAAGRRAEGFDLGPEQVASG